MGRSDHVSCHCLSPACLCFPLLFLLPVWGAHAVSAGQGPDGAAATLPSRMASLQIGGRLRVRGALRSPFPDAPDRTTDAVLQRTRIHFNADIHERLGVLLEIQDSRVWGEELASTGDLEGLDLRQGYMTFRKVLGWPMDIKIGRMEIEGLGDQRLIGTQDWSNVSRVWDGMYNTFASDRWRLNDMYFFLANQEGIKAAADYMFSGEYVSYRGLEDHEFDAYAFYRDNGDAIEAITGIPGPLDDRTDWTLGLRVEGVPGDFRYTGEAAFQFGSQGGRDVRAWMAVLTGAYRFRGLAWEPMLGLEYAVASGDDDPGDEDIGTFDPLLPFEHAHHGHMDLFLFRNLRNFKLAASMAPLEDWTLHLDQHLFFRSAKEDAWYGPGFVRTAPGSHARYMGYEVDLYAKGKVLERARIWAGYSHFFAGDFVAASGFDGDADFLFAQVEVTF